MEEKEDSGNDPNGEQSFALCPQPKPPGRRYGCSARGDAVAVAPPLSPAPRRRRRGLLGLALTTTALHVVADLRVPDARAV